MKLPSHRKLLVAYLTAGDPDIETSYAAACAAVDAGADALEIGVPFSDPLADGPVIQRAMGRALQSGGGLAQALDLVARLRACVACPVILFTYLNPVLRTGVPATLQRLSDVGGDGLLVVDLPMEESESMRAEATARGLAWIGLVAPTTSAERAERIARSSSGFVYLVSMTGVTGSTLPDLAPVAARVLELRSATDLPLCIGFGIHDAASARLAAQVSDGVVVGSAIVAALEQDVRAVARVVRDIRAGLSDA